MNKAQFGILAEYYLDWIKQYQYIDCNKRSHGCIGCILKEHREECMFNFYVRNTKKVAEQVVEKYGMKK